jgi:hypothetical protein
MQLQQFHTNITPCHCLNLVTAPGPTKMIRLKQNTVQNKKNRVKLSLFATMIRLRNTVENLQLFEIFATAPAPLQRYGSATMLRTLYIYILLLSDFFRIRCRGVRTKIVRTKVPFGHVSYSEQFRSEKKTFGDMTFGDWPFGDRAFGDLTVYLKNR